MRPNCPSRLPIYSLKARLTDILPLLHYAFKDCPSLAPQIDRARFSRKEMIKITKEYHYDQCVTSNEDCQLNLKQKKIKRSIQLDN